nr:XdhC family protein [Pseudomarimonas arenosa]
MARDGAFPLSPTPLPRGERGSRACTAPATAACKLDPQPRAQSTSLESPSDSATTKSPAPLAGEGRGGNLAAGNDNPAATKRETSTTTTPPFRSPIHNPLQLLCQRHCEGLRSCLVTIVGIEGTSPRRLGAQLVVTEAGEVAGSISGGCLDTSVIERAIACLQLGQSQRIRYGAGSPYIDLTLPCGSGLDLQFDGDIPHPTLSRITEHIDQRRLINMFWRSANQPPELMIDQDSEPSPTDEAVQIRIAPRLRVFVAGNGDNLLAFCRLARASQLEVVALHPDPALAPLLIELGVESRLLQSPQLLPTLPWDAFSAGFTLFHDHHWELPFLLQALDSHALMIGAMGSQRAQANRLEQLRVHGASEAALQRLRGPIGLLPRARDPEELAVSVLGELMQSYRQQCRRHGMAA